ncbi:MAG: hypothetical protein PHE78_04405 [Candidatus Gastranaerophilales bacterium]|nr:hypothetical protein [Candidatus Gastranaerophilales bacterium]
MQAFDFVWFLLLLCCYQCYKNANTKKLFSCTEKENWEICDFLYTVEGVKKYKDVVIKASNFGRVARDECGKLNIIEQFDIEKDYGELYIPEFWKSLRVWTLIAHAWIEKDDTQEENLGPWQVHHISNNGYDQRPENLIWIRRNLHLNYIHRN